MATAKRRPFHEMDHDHELLREEIVYASRTELRGPIPEFLAKKRAEQAPGTAAGYEVVLGVFERFCQEYGIATVGQLVEGVAHDFITAERERGMSARTIHDRVRRLKTWTRWMRKRGWTERDRWEDVQTPRADLADFDLIDPELRRAAFQEFDGEPSWAHAIRQSSPCCPTVVCVVTSCASSRTPMSISPICRCASMLRRPDKRPGGSCLSQMRRRRSWPTMCGYANATWSDRRASGLTQATMDSAAKRSAASTPTAS